MEVKDLAGLSQPFTKLIETVSAGVGRIYEPTHIRRMAKVKAFELETISNSVKKLGINLDTVEYNDSQFHLKSKDQEDNNELISLKERAVNRLTYQEMKRQQNIESIVGQSLDELQDEEKISDEKVNEDWTTRFFNYAQDISEEEMQRLWAKILADELRKPGRFSLRTLDLVRNLTKEEAEVFQKIGCLIIRELHKISIDGFIFKGPKDSTPTNFISDFNISFNDIILLREIGLLANSDNIVRLINNTYESNLVKNFTCGNHVVILDVKPNSSKIEIPIYLLTVAGKELFQVLKPKSIPEYLKAFKDFLNTEYSETHTLEIPNDYDTHSSSHFWHPPKHIKL